MNTLDNSIVLVGGYGVVGAQLAALLAEHHPNLNVVLAGRNPSATTVNGFATVQLDCSQPIPLSAVQGCPQAVVSLANDPDDYLLMDCAERGIAYLDITRWTERLQRSCQYLEQQTLKAPVLLSSGWMGGVAAIASAALASGLSELESVDIDILFYMKDRAGPNSVEYIDQLAKPYAVQQQGQVQTIQPLSRGRTAAFSSGKRRRVYAFDTPERQTLLQTLGSAGAISRIGFDSRFTTYFLVFLKRFGILKALSGDRFRGLRRALLHSPGNGAPHELVVSVKGRSTEGVVVSRSLNIVDPLGQTHMTACGAFIQLERLLNLDGLGELSHRLHYPEQHASPTAALKRLGELGVNADKPM